LGRESMISQWWAAGSVGSDERGSWLGALVDHDV